MCLVLKLDSGKVVSIADEQTDRRTKPPSTILVYRYILHKIYTLLDLAPPKQNFWVRQWTSSKYVSEDSMKWKKNWQKKLSTNFFKKKKFIKKG